jgi:hypothetical protein
LGLRQGTLTERVGSEQSTSLLQQKFRLNTFNITNISYLFEEHATFMRRSTVLAKQRQLGERYKETEREIDKEIWGQYGDTIFSFSYYFKVQSGI